MTGPLVLQGWAGTGVRADGADDDEHVEVGDEAGAGQELPDQADHAVVVALDGRGQRADAAVGGQADELDEQLTAEAHALPPVLDEDRELGGRGVVGGAVVAGDADDLASDEADDGLAQVVVDGHEPLDRLGRQAAQRGVEAAVDRVGGQPWPQPAEQGPVIGLHGSRRDGDVHSDLLSSLDELCSSQVGFVK